MLRQFLKLCGDVVLFSWLVGHEGWFVYGRLLNDVEALLPAKHLPCASSLSQVPCSRPEQC